MTLPAKSLYSFKLNEKIALLLQTTLKRGILKTSMYTMIGDKTLGLFFYDVT